MAWTVGTVAISDTGALTDSGAALALYNALLAEEIAEVPLPDPDNPPADWPGSAEEWRQQMEPAVVAIKRRLARTARGCASGLIVFAKANIVVSGSSVT